MHLAATRPLIEQTAFAAHSVHFYATSLIDGNLLLTNFLSGLIDSAYAQIHTKVLLYLQIVQSTVIPQQKLSSNIFVHRSGAKKDFSNFQTLNTVQNNSFASSSNQKTATT